MGMSGFAVLLRRRTSAVHGRLPIHVRAYICMAVREMITRISGMYCTYLQCVVAVGEYIHISSSSM